MCRPPYRQREANLAPPYFSRRWHGCTGLSSIQTGTIASLVILGVFCTGFAYILFFRMIAMVGATKALSVTFAVPVFAAFYGVTFLGEHITPYMVACAAVILAGISLSTGLLRPFK